MASHRSYDLTLQLGGDRRAQVIGEIQPPLDNMNEKEQPISPMQPLQDTEQPSQSRRGGAISFESQQHNGGTLRWKSESESASVLAHSSNLMSRGSVPFSHS